MSVAIKEWWPKNIHQTHFLKMLATRQLKYLKLNDLPHQMLETAVDVLNSVAIRHSVCIFLCISILKIICYCYQTTDFIINLYSFIYNILFIIHIAFGSIKDLEF